MNLEFSRYFSNRDMESLLDLSHASLRCCSHESLKDMIKKLETLFPFDSALYACSTIEKLKRDKPLVDIEVIRYPKDYLKTYFKNRYHLTDAVIWNFFKIQKPLNWINIERKIRGGYPAMRLARDCNMRDGWTHGSFDTETNGFCLFFFGNAYRNCDPRTQKILEYIIPFFAEAHKRSDTPLRINRSILTTRETEILNWVKEGKGSWEISVILNRSKRTVDFHISNMKKKLGATNRAQLVAIALNNQLIKF